MKNLIAWFILQSQKITVSKDAVKSVLPNSTSLEGLLLQATSDTEFLQLVDNTVIARVKEPKFFNLALMGSYVNGT